MPVFSRAAGGRPRHSSGLSAESAPIHYCLPGIFHEYIIGAARRCTGHPLPDEGHKRSMWGQRLLLSLAPGGLERQLAAHKDGGAVQWKGEQTAGGMLYTELASRL